MNGKPSKLLALVLTAGLGATGLQAEEQRSARDVRPSYPRHRAQRSTVPEPERQPLPASLRIALPRDEVSPPVRDEGAARIGASTRRGPAQPAPHDNLEARAHAAAAWAADEAIECFGGPRYFEVGFHEGIRDAFRRTRHDRWEFEQGRSSGRLDRLALGLGEEIGYEEARLAAAEDAQRAVVGQFTDLTRERVPLPPPLPPHFAASGFAVAEPELRDVFDDLAWRGHRASGFRDLRLDPWRLYQAGRHGDFYRHDWRTARFGLDLWRKGHRESGWLRRLDGDERRVFEERFERAFETELARRFARLADQAFERGYDAGWRHGVRIGREWQYRRGYHLGFEAAVREVARRAFHDSFRPAWAAAYDSLFREWSTTVKLEARAARLRDGNDDGIFEPGEVLFAELELVNLGGGSGRFDARLAGAVLTASDRRTIDLPRRSSVGRIAPLQGVVSPAAAPMTDTALTVSIGEFTKSLPLQISHVLRFEDRILLASHDTLRGTAVVEVRVVNASRRAVVASFDATLHRGTLREPHRELSRLPAGAIRNLRFEIHGAHPLDLVGGDLLLTVAAATGGRPQGRLEARLPELATDLADSGLIDYLQWLARSSTPSRGEVGRAYDLMLRRLEVDWQAAVRQNGNPYKSDLHNRTGATALGELVAAARAERRHGGDRRVFADLVPRIEELSRSLPGAHPFLRRSMRKLSRQLL